eukprot:gene17651-biopygen822
MPCFWNHAAAAESTSLCPHPHPHARREVGRLEGEAEQPAGPSNGGRDRGREGVGARKSVGGGTQGPGEQLRLPQAPCGAPEHPIPNSARAQCPCEGRAPADSRGS